MVWSGQLVLEGGAILWGRLTLEFLARRRTLVSWLLLHRWLGWISLLSVLVSCLEFSFWGAGWLGFCEDLADGGFQIGTCGGGES